MRLRHNPSCKIFVPICHGILDNDAWEQDHNIKARGGHAGMRGVVQEDAAHRAITQGYVCGSVVGGNP